MRRSGCPPRPGAFRKNTASAPLPRGSHLAGLGWVQVLEFLFLFSAPSLLGQVAGQEMYKISPEYLVTPNRTRAGKRPQMQPKAALTSPERDNLSCNTETKAEGLRHVTF